jgi:predicted ABC-type ATPase
VGTNPLVVVLSGPNGAGKSTAADQILPTELMFLNADEIAKTLPGYPSPGVDRQAARRILEMLDSLEERRAGFSVETTLASRSLAHRLVRLRSVGYVVRLIYLWTPSPEFSIWRVAERVRAGGHGIPEDAIRRSTPLEVANRSQIIVFRSQDDKREKRGKLGYFTVFRTIPSPAFTPLVPLAS